MSISPPLKAMTAAYPRLVLTPGEPAGIGPDVTLQIAQKAWDCELMVIADPELLSARARQLNLPLTLHTYASGSSRTKHQPGHLHVLPVPLATPSQPGRLDQANAAYVLQCLEQAVELCLTQKADALVTGPVHKAHIQRAGTPFTGHTEFLAERTGAKEVLMLFVVDQLKVALATTHLPLAQVPQAITQDKLARTLRLLNRSLQQVFHIPHPTLYVAGLNPHAGEGGALGSEEITIIEPTLTKLQAEGIQALGPFPADTLFTPKLMAKTDAILAMYHDQALPVVKHLGFDRAVNLTLGLPFIRTSVDHGTALDIAGTGQADAGSLSAALQLAIDLTTR